MKKCIKYNVIILKEKKRSDYFVNKCITNLMSYVY